MFHSTFTLVVVLLTIFHSFFSNFFQSPLFFPTELHKFTKYFITKNNTNTKITWGNTQKSQSLLYSSKMGGTYCSPFPATCSSINLVLYYIVPLNSHHSSHEYWPYFEAMFVVILVYLNMILLSYIEDLLTPHGHLHDPKY